jgi:hypothetical protein
MRFAELVCLRRAKSHGQDEGKVTEPLHYAHGYFIVKPRIYQGAECAIVCHCVSGTKNSKPNNVGRHQDCSKFHRPYDLTNLFSIENCAKLRDCTRIIGSENIAIGRQAS